ncbi:hypothetical protein KEM56_004634 [Ascosphaera pollenicola]|nr:hypothetical protein KEM56_004634 [Ascosphaera pollenicola]
MSTPTPTPAPAEPADPQGRRSEPPDQSEPSPRAAPPVPLTPGPRASRLQQVYAKALQSTLRANSYANFSACFPTPAKHASRSLESVWRQLNAKLEQSAQAEFEDILKERDAVRGLNELDRLVGEARLRQRSGEGGNTVPPHTLPPEELYKAHLAPYLIKSKAALDEQMKSAGEENIRLSETIQKQRQQIQKLLTSLDSVIDDLEAAAKVTAQFDQDTKMRDEAEEVHAQTSTQISAMPPL